MNPQLEQQLERWLAALNLRFALGTLALVVFLIAWNRGIALLYGMFALIIGVMVVAWAVPRWNLRHIAARRQLPARAHEGDEVALEVALTVEGRRSRYMLEVSDHLPFAAEGAQRPTAFFPRVKGEGELRYRVTCDLRGLHTVGPLELRSSYPLGIATANRTLADTQAQILVYPATFPIARLHLLGGSHRPVAGGQAVNRGGGNDEFVAVRDYRDGDSMRLIHWPATARRGEMVVREHEYLHATDLMLVLDLRRAAQFGRGKASTLEYMVTIAASIARYALEQGHGVGLYAHGAAPVEVPSGHGPQQFQALLEVLARVQAEGDTPYGRVVGEAAARLPLGGALVLFDIPTAAGAEPPPLEGAGRHHLRLLPITLDSASFSPALSRRAKVAPGGYLVRCGDDLAKVFAR